MVLDNSNINLTPSQKALLKLHFCLGCFNLPLIQKLIAQGVLEMTEHDDSKECNMQLHGMSACQANLEI